jgi:hypothetical protein
MVEKQRKEVAGNLIKKSVSMNFVFQTGPSASALGQPDDNIQ